MSETSKRTALFIDELYFDVIWGKRFEYPFIESGCDMRSVRSALGALFNSKIVYSHCFSVLPDLVSGGWTSPTIARPPAGAGFHATVSSSFNLPANEAVLEGTLTSLADFAGRELNAESLILVGHPPHYARKALLSGSLGPDASAIVLWDFEEHELFWNVDDWTVFIWNFGLDADDERAKTDGRMKFEDLVPVLSRIKDFA